MEVFEEVDGQFVLAQRLCSDNMQQANEFGDFVALEGNALVTSEPGSLSVFVFKRDAGGQWMRAQKFTPPSGGSTVDMDVALFGNTLLVGTQDSSGGDGGGDLYTRANADAPFEHEQTLAPQTPDSDHGHRVALAANTAVLLSAEGGRLSIFERGAGTWTETASFTNAGAGLGNHVSISEDGVTVFAGAPTDQIDVGGSLQATGTVLVFQKDGGGAWSQSPSRLRAANPIEDHFFGHAVTTVRGEPELVALSADVPGGGNIFGLRDQQVHRMTPSTRAGLYVEAPGADPNTAIFRYKVHLYGPDAAEPTVLIPTPEEIANFYDTADREAYDAVPGPAQDEAGNEFEDGGFVPGSELWQQFQNIRRARIGIATNRQRMNNLLREVDIEIERNLFETATRGDIAQVQLEYAGRRASIARTIGRLETAQKYADKLTKALNPKNWGEAIGNAISAGVQVGTDLAITELKAEREQLAGLEQVQVTALENQILNANSRAKVRTLMLDMNTLVLDSQDLAIALSQELGRLTGLYREKRELEHRIDAFSATAERRFQGDPVHRLRVLFELNIARRKIDIAQQFTFYLARALEYKWNEPFNDIMTGTGYKFDDIFRLRNAKEIDLFVDEMEGADGRYGTQSRERSTATDRFSLRKHAFNLGDDIAAFRETLSGLVEGDTLAIPFSTVRDAPDNDTATFFLGPRNFTVSPASGRILTGEPGAYADQIVSFQVTIPGNHSTGEADTRARIVYGGTSFVRSRRPGTYPDYADRPDRLVDEIASAPVRIPTASGTAWQYSSTLDVLGRAMLVSGNPPAGTNVFDGLRERSVAANGWELRLTIAEQDGTPIVNLSEIDDIVLHFEHSFIPRQSN